MKHLLYISLLLWMTPATAAQSIGADDARITFSGRVVRSALSVRFDWPGVAINFRATGGNVDVLLNGNGSDYNVYVDGSFTRVWRGAPGVRAQTLRLAAGDHAVSIVRRNDGNHGTAVFSGLRLSHGSMLLEAPAVPHRRIEFIGDSITVGYGVEGPGSTCVNLRQYENASMAFAALTASALEAEPHIIAMSAKGLIRNYGDKQSFSAKPMPVYWRQTLARSEAADWDFSDWQPDAVVIKLGTNDYSKPPVPPLDDFAAGLIRVIAEVREVYKSDTPIFLVAESALPQVLQAYQRVAKELGGNGIELVQVGSPLDAAAVGCQGHPGIDAQQRMAETLIMAMRESLNWH